MTDSLPDDEASETATDTGVVKKVSLWESKLVLLIVGFILSGLLVPLIQHNYEHIKWRRQALYDTTNFRITKMREALQELSNLHSVFAELSSRFDAYSQSNMTTAAFFEKYQEIQQRRFQAGARFSSSLVYFPPQSDLSASYNSYLRTTEAYVARISGAATRPQVTDEGQRVEAHIIDGRFQKVQDDYEELVSILREELQQLCNEQASRF